MTRASVAIVVLSGALVATNAWWLYQAVDSGVTATYRDVSLREHHEALAQALAVLPVAARIDSTPAEVLAVAAEAASGKDAFEKDGFTWVGQLGLQFGEDGRLKGASPAWSPF